MCRAWAWLASSRPREATSLDRRTPHRINGGREALERADRAVHRDTADGRAGSARSRPTQARVSSRCRHRRGRPRTERVRPRTGVTEPQRGGGMLAMPMATDSLPSTSDPRGAARSAASARRGTGVAASARPTKTPRWTPAPILVRHVRNGIVESVHRGDVVEVDANGRMLHVLGDPDRLVTLRSTVKPFGTVALLEAGGAEAFELGAADVALLCSSHSGEDLHVRTLQAMFRRAGVSQGLLACGTEGMPLDQLTAARLARDGERPSPVRHMCSGQHAVFILLARIRDWPLEGYWEIDHPAHIAYREVVARAYGVQPERLRT